jgi:hypothetical protein
MGRRPVRGWIKGAMTPAQRQARRRQLLRQDAEREGLVKHVERVLKQAGATERARLLDQLIPLIEAYQEDRRALEAMWEKS